jgi:beta-1,2-mannobiose phosphorylase / 1,2-beta-oligomannan phosphorylase
MLTVNKLGILISKTEHGFESEGVLNPAVIKVGADIHLFYRAVAKNNYSTIGYCRLSSPTTVETRNDLPLLFPEADYEIQGVEDPRIVKIEGTYYLSYTAFDGVNALGAMATSSDLVHWKKLGIVVPQITYEEFRHFAEAKGVLHEKYIRFNEYQKSHEKQGQKSFIWNKNLILFPRKINNEFCFLQRIRPDIQMAVSVKSLEKLTKQFWEDYFFHFDESVVLSPRHPHEVSYIGGGCPPVETPQGWVIIYHGVHDTVNGYVYSACAALLDLKNPEKEIARLPYPLFFPEEEWELKGEVNNVCFPTGTVLQNDMLYIYYGAADERIAVASVSLPELLEELLKHKT